MDMLKFDASKSISNIKNKFVSYPTEERQETNNNNE